MITKIVDRLAQRIRWGYLTAFVLLLSSYILTFYTTQKLLAESAFVEHTNKEMNTINQTVSSTDSIDHYAATTHDKIQHTISESGRELKSSSYLIRLFNIVSLVIAILLTFYSIITFNNEHSAKRKAENNALAYRQLLENQVAELNKVNAELVELKSIEKFAATGRIARTIAHEVRNPLTNINLATEHLQSDLPMNSEIELLLEMINRNSTRINNLISDLLNSTKATQLDFQLMSLDLLLDETLFLAKDRIELKSIKLIKEYATDLPLLMVDHEKIKIAFLNIIINAIEAMEPEFGILRVLTFKKDNKPSVQIIDNGKGLSKEELDKLFEPYFTTKENGSGLGLTNTQNILLSHNANILVESTEGSGTTFTIAFDHT